MSVAVDLFAAIGAWSSLSCVFVGGYVTLTTWAKRRRAKRRGADVVASVEAYLRDPNNAL